MQLLDRDYHRAIQLPAGGLSLLPNEEMDLAGSAFLISGRPTVLPTANLFSDERPQMVSQSLVLSAIAANPMSMEVVDSSSLGIRDEQVGDWMFEANVDINAWETHSTSEAHNLVQSIEELQVDISGAEALVPVDDAVGDKSAVPWNERSADNQELVIMALELLDLLS